MKIVFSIILAGYVFVNILGAIASTTTFEETVSNRHESIAQQINFE